MSLKPHNLPVSVFSAADFTSYAIGSPHKIKGDRGFQNLRHGDWCHWYHFQQINRRRPDLSDPRESTVAEMGGYRENHVKHLMKLAAELDEGIKRLAMMEWEMQQVIKAKEEQES